MKSCVTSFLMLAVLAVAHAASPDDRGESSGPDEALFDAYFQRCLEHQQDLRERTEQNLRDAEERIDRIRELPRAASRQEASTRRETMRLSRRTIRLAEVTLRRLSKEGVSPVLAPLELLLVKQTGGLGALPEGDALALVHKVDDENAVFRYRHTSYRKVRVRGRTGAIGGGVPPWQTGHLGGVAEIPEVVERRIWVRGVDVSDKRRGDGLDEHAGRLFWVAGWESYAVAPHEEPIYDSVWGPEVDKSGTLTIPVIRPVDEARWQAYLRRVGAARVAPE